MLPAKDKVSLVTSRSFDEYSPAELASQLDYNPFSFLHVLQPAYKNLQSFDPEKRFKLVAQKYRDFLAEDILTRTDKPAFFVYKIQNASREFTGVVAAVSLEDYRNGIIKKHEDTLEYRVSLFKDYLHQTGFNTEPVLLFYDQSTPLQKWIDQKKTDNPTFEFSTTKKEKHTLWKVDDAESIDFLQKTFGEMPELYIADGHHRSASAQMLYDEDKASGNKHLDFFMAFMLPADQVHIHEYNRVVRDLNGHSTAEFIKLLEKRFVVKDTLHDIWKPQKKSTFGMYLDGKFFSVEPKKASNELDAALLYNEILKPLLNIGDLRTDERIEYIAGKETPYAVKQAVDQGDFAIGFLLFPPSIEEIKTLADNNEIMPPKSTFIEPKIRSGLVIYEI